MCSSDLNDNATTGFSGSMFLSIQLWSRPSYLNSEDTNSGATVGFGVGLLAPAAGLAVGVGTTAVGVAVGAVLGLFVFGAVVTAGAFVTAGFFALTVTLQVSFFFQTFANTTALPAFLTFTTTLVFFFFERLTTFLPDLMDQTAFFPFFSLIVFFCPAEMLTFFVLSFGAFFFAAAGEDGIDTPRSNAAVIT